LLFGLIDEIVVTDEACTQRIPGRLASQVTVIPPCVDLAKFVKAAETDREGTRRRFGFPSDAVVIVYAGHLLLQRGLARVAEAHRLLRSSLGGRSVLTVVASSGFESKSATDLLDSFQREFAGEVVRLQFVPDIELLFKSADFVVLPLEDYGVAICPPVTSIEALLAGTEVMTTPFAGAMLKMKSVFGSRIKISAGPKTFASELVSALVNKTESPPEDAFLFAQKWRDLSLRAYDEIYGDTAGFDNDDK